MLRREINRRRDEGGFSLIELLVVIVVLSTLSGIVVFAVGGIPDKSQSVARNTEKQTLQIAEEALYATTTGAATYGDVQALVTANLINADSMVSTGTTAHFLVTPKDLGPPADWSSYNLTAINQCT